MHRCRFSIPSGLGRRVKSKCPFSIFGRFGRSKLRFISILLRAETSRSLICWLLETSNRRGHFNFSKMLSYSNSQHQVFLVTARDCSKLADRELKVFPCLGVTYETYITCRSWLSGTKWKLQRNSQQRFIYLKSSFKGNENYLWQGKTWLVNNQGKQNGN